MATTTPNFGWSVPTSSDLVKNGATAIETLGDSIDASLVDLKGGTTGQVLAKATGTDMDFTWTTAGSGKVLQVVNVIYGTETSTSSLTFADTGLTATITPTSATSKILVFMTMPTFKDTNNTNGEFKLIRGATTIATLANAAKNGSTAGNDIGAVAINYLDSPATTSATTYKVQFASQENNTRVVICRAGGLTNQSSITLMEIGVEWLQVQRF
jgi:hypothetical protein